MPQHTRKPVPSNRGRGPQYPAPVHMHPNQPRSAPQMQYMPQNQHHYPHLHTPNNSNPQVAHLQHQQNVQRGQIAQHGAQLNQHSAALQRQSADQHRQNIAQQKQFAKQNAQTQKQMVQQNAANQKQRAKQNAMMQKQNAHMNHELQALKHQQKLQLHKGHPGGGGHVGGGGNGNGNGNGKKILAGAAVGTAMGVGGAVIYEEYREERYTQEQIIRNENQEPSDRDSTNGYYQDERYENNNEQYWPQENNPGGYYSPQDTFEPAQSTSGGGNGDNNEDGCCGDCCSDCCGDFCGDWGCCWSDSKKGDDESCCCCC